jgi:hypothetical protein
MWPTDAPKNFEEVVIKNFSRKMFKGSLHGNNTTSKLINVKTCSRGRITPKNENELKHAWLTDFNYMAMFSLSSDTILI